MHTSFSARLRRAGQSAASWGLAIALVLFIAVCAPAQKPESAGPAAGGRILLVLPFDNRTSQPSLEWIREAAPEILGSRFASAGFAPMSRADRIYALDHLGLPQGFHPSRASSLKLAQTLDADSIVVGSYVTDGTGIVAEASLVDVPHLRMSETVTARGEMRDMIAVFDSLAWKLTRQLDPGFKVSQETFVAAGSSLRLDAFEQYIRGITEPDQTERLRHLNLAVKLSPELSQAWMALGREDYNSQRYELAAVAFSNVDRNNADALQAGFYRGLSLLFSGDYPKAEEAFAGVARVLPLAAVLNNQGVALARRGKDGIPLFRQAVAADSSAADYHFNLAVSLKRKGDTAEALSELGLCLHLRPNDSEALTVQKAWKGPAADPASPASAGADDQASVRVDPLERIERSFDAAAFRQAALMLDQVDVAHLAVLAPHERAQKLSVQAKDFLDRGLLLEAERLYLSALAADDSVAEAHAGLAEVRERTGDADAARKEAVTSLERMPSPGAYLVLARLDFAANRLDQARREIASALQIDPKNRPAQELTRQIDAKNGQKR